MDCPDDIELCVDDAPITLSGATPEIGTYSGAGVDAGEFDPAAAGVGIHVITYTYTNPQTTCTNFCTFEITVYELPVVTIEDVADVCLDEDGNGSVELKANVSVGSGSWSVKDPDNAPGPVQFSDENAFETTATVSFCGTYTFVFTAENGECEASAEIAVTFFSLPVVTVTGPEVVCGRTANLILTVTAPCFEPVDGEWSWEPAILDVTFEAGPAGWEVTVPECGVYTFTYTADNNPIR